MKIAFDLRRIANPGIGRYMKCLVEAVLGLDIRSVDLRNLYGASKLLVLNLDIRLYRLIAMTIYDV